MNLLDTHCVSINNKVGKPVEGELRVHPKLEGIITKLMLDRPNWSYEFVSRNYQNELTEFQIKQDDEVLGKVEWEYVRGGMGYGVYNHRIREARQRGAGYKTQHWDKAVAAIKKQFSKKTVNELVDSASVLAVTTTRNAHNDKYQQMAQHNRVVERAALKFAMGEGFAMFMLHVNTVLPKNEMQTVTESYAKYKELSSEANVIRNMNVGLADGKSLVVVRDGSDYHVHNSKDTATYTDATLPEFMRGKLGMLKLAEKNQYLTTIGCKIDDNVFVIVNEEKTDEGISE